MGSRDTVLRAAKQRTSTESFAPRALERKLDSKLDSAPTFTAVARRADDCAWARAQSYHKRVICELTARSACASASVLSPASASSPRAMQMARA